MDARKHAQVIDQVTDDIQAGVFDNIKALENRLATIVASGVDITQLRTSIVTEFEQYSASIKAETGLVKQISEDVTADTGRTTEDDQAEQALAEQTGNQVAQQVRNGAEGVITALTLAAAAGAGGDQLAKIARARVSGVFMETEDQLTKKAQRTLTRLLASKTSDTEEIRKATKVIRERLTDVNVTNSVRDLTSKAVQDTVMQFDGAFIKGNATRRGITRYRYEGGIVGDSREFCRQMEGEVLDEETIYSIWDDDWQGKEPGDPFVVRGGYNCRHFWVPVEEDE